MNIAQNEVQIGPYTMFYRTAGSGDQTLLLLHGIPTNSMLWINVIPLLAQKYTVIVPDMIGYGRSSRADIEELTLPKQANHIISLLNVLGIQRVHVVGHDLGGGVAQNLAVYNPERITSFVIIDGVAFSNWPLPKVIALRYPTAPEFEPSLMFIERMIREGLFHQELLTPEILEAFLLPYNHPNGAKELQAAALALDHRQTEELVPYLQEIKIPATFLYGQYDRYLPAYWGLRLQQLVPNSNFKVLNECSHYSMIDKPLLVSQEIISHVTSVVGT